MALKLLNPCPYEIYGYIALGFTSNFHVYFVSNRDGMGIVAKIFFLHFVRHQLYPRVSCHQNSERFEVFGIGGHGFRSSD